MPALTKSLVTIPDEAIKRLRSLERLDESPFLQRKSLRSSSGAAGSRRKSGSSNNEYTSTSSSGAQNSPTTRTSGVPQPVSSTPANPTDPQIASRKAKSVIIAGTTSSTGGPETPFPVDSSLGRRPRELPWLVTPAPAANQAASPAPASFSSRPARPSTTPATASVAGQLDAAAVGDNVGGVGLPRSRSIASAGGSGQGGVEQDQQQRGRNGDATSQRAQGKAAGNSAFGQRTTSLGSGGSKKAGGPRGNQEYEDDEAAEAEMAAAAAAMEAELAESERARLRRQALTCAGSMELPVGSSSSSTADGGHEGYGEGVAEGLGPGLAVKGSPSLEGRRGAGRSVARGPALLAQQVLPSLPPPAPGSPKRAPSHHVRAAAWLAIVKIEDKEVPYAPFYRSTTLQHALASSRLSSSAEMVAFVERSSAALSSTSALPLDGLEAELLRLLPFRFTNDGVDEDGDRRPQSSSCRSFTSSSSSLSGLNDGGGGGSDSDAESLEDGGSGGGGDSAGAGDDEGQDSRKASGTDHERAAERKGNNNAPIVTGHRQVRSSASTDGTKSRPAQSPQQLPLSPPAADVAGDAEARPDTGGSDCSSPSAKHRKRDALPSVSGGDSHSSSIHRCHNASSTRKSGWVRGRSRDFHSPASRGEIRRSRSRGERGTAKSSAAGCWAPPPTRWGGTPIRSPLFWSDRGDNFDDVAHRQANDMGSNRGEGRHFSGSSGPSPILGGDSAARYGERVPEWEGEGEGYRGAQGSDFGITGEFFRTSDGRSLFAESLGSLGSHDGGSSKRRRPEIQWGESSNDGNDGPLGGSGDRLGFVCLLGEEGYRASDRGNAESTRLGAAARHRRTRIDARSRDGKRRAEALSARRRIKRLEDECVWRRTDKLERRANLTKSRGEAAVRVAGDRGKTLLWVMALASRTCHLSKLLTEAKGRREAHRSHLATVTFALRIQRAWRSFREEAQAGGSGAKTMRQTIDAILRVSSRFVICRRARVLALLKLWPEGETTVKIEMRTGKRIRTDGSWKSPSCRKSSRLEPMQSVVPRGSMLMGGSTFAVMQSGGHSGHGAAIGATPVAAAAPMAEAMAATAAAAPHVSPPWLPRLVKQMETRKHETVHRLIKTQEKLFRHRQANEAAWVPMTSVGRAHQEGQHHQHLARHGHRETDRRGSGSGSTGDGGGSSVASARTDATISSAGSGTEKHQRGQEHRQEHHRSSRAVTASSERSQGDDTTQGSLSSSVDSRGRKDKKKKRRSQRPGGDRGGTAKSGSGGGAGGLAKVVSISAESDLGEIFDDGDGQDGSPASRAIPLAGAGKHHQFSRTTPASSSSGSIHRVLSATGGIAQSHHQLQHGSSSHRAPAFMRDMTSLQLLSGAGWLTRLSEIDKEIDSAPLVPLPVKLATIESFLRAETMERMKSTRRDRASKRVHHEEATLATAKALLHGSIEDFVDQVEATQSSGRISILQLYSGQARLRFMAEVDKKVRLHMEKGNRRAPVGVRT